MKTRARARKLRMPGVVPTHPTVQASNMISRGELTLGEPCKLFPDYLLKLES